MDYEELVAARPIGSKDQQAAQQDRQQINQLKNDLKSLQAAYEDLKALTVARFERETSDMNSARTEEVSERDRKKLNMAPDEDKGYFASYAENA